MSSSSLDSPRAVPLDPRAKTLLRPHFLRGGPVDLEKVIVIINAPLRPGVASDAAPIGPKGFLYIRFAPGTYVFDPSFNPALVARLYPQSPFAAGVGLIAHELGHIRQRLTVPGFDAMFKEAVDTFGHGPDNPFEIYPNAIEREVQMDVARQRGEDFLPPPGPP